MYILIVVAVIVALTVLFSIPATRVAILNAIQGVVGWMAVGVDWLIFNFFGVHVPAVVGAVAPVIGGAIALAMAAVFLFTGALVISGVALAAALLFGSPNLVMIAAVLFGSLILCAWIFMHWLRGNVGRWIRIQPTRTLAFLLLMTLIGFMIAFANEMFGEWWRAVVVTLFTGAGIIFILTSTEEEYVIVSSGESRWNWFGRGRGRILSSSFTAHSFLVTGAIIVFVLGAYVYVFPEHLRSAKALKVSIAKRLGLVSFDEENYAFNTTGTIVKEAAVWQIGEKDAEGNVKRTALRDENGFVTLPVNYRVKSRDPQANVTVADGTYLEILLPITGLEEEYQAYNPKARLYIDAKKVRLDDQSERASK